MRLSTSTNFFADRRDGDCTPYVEAMRRCKAAGFNVLDANFCPAFVGKGDLVKENWMEKMAELRNEAEKLGIEFSQSHPVYIPGSIQKQTAETMEVFKEMMRRSIIASSILGVKWAVLHPIEEKILTEFDTEANIRANFQFFAPVVELAKKNNVGLAFENMIERLNTKRRFSSHAGELTALVDTYNDPGVGACWDFGHGNFLYRNQGIALRTLGKRLKAVHVDDNYGLEDDHMFPFHGTIDWHSIMPVLTEIGYEGDFTYEAHKEFYKMPEHLKDSLAKVAYELGNYCLSLA